MAHRKLQVAATTNLLFFLFAAFALSICAAATTYTVGDNSGWDISTDLDTWAQDKRFNVGDSLLFQYSSSQTVEEVNKPAFDGCNTTETIKTFTNGNTTVALNRPGPWFFVSGNRLYCLSGMKLQVNVEGSSASSPIGSPQAQPQGGDGDDGSSSKTNSPSSSGHVLGSSGSFGSFATLLLATFVTVYSF